MAEHVNRHSHVSEYFVQKGFVVFGLDHQGFGRSEGDRAHVEFFQDYADDVKQFITEIIPERYPELESLPKFIMGHSMGKFPLRK